MKILAALFVLLFFGPVTGCTPPPVLPENNTSLNETWPKQINTQPNLWLKNADNWFVTGNPNKLEKSLNKAQAARAEDIVAQTLLRSSFNEIVVAGNFQVQIIGGQAKDSISAYGPRDLLKALKIESIGHKISILPAEGVINLDRVIVRIGIKNLRKLTNLGAGDILGRGVTSKALMVTLQGSGNIYLGGNMNLKQVNQLGMGTITIIGAFTPSLFIEAPGDGLINISGRVGIQSIHQTGNGCIRIIGADSDSLCINTFAAGRIEVVGTVNLQELKARGRSRIYMTCLRSSQLKVLAQNSAHVAFAGIAVQAHVYVADEARFSGQYLKTENMFVNTKNKAQANVSAYHEVFVSAQDQSQVYYYGQRTQMNNQISVNARVISLDLEPEKFKNFSESCAISLH